MKRYLNVGGLVAAGFDSSGKYLLTVSHSGSGVFSTQTWERIARDLETSYPENGVAIGIGPIEGELIAIVKIDYGTGKLHLSSGDGRFSLDYNEGMVEVTTEDEKSMHDTSNLISALATAPGVIIPLIREVPPQILKRRPSPAKWSAYEHACHLSQSDVAFRARLDLILSTPDPHIETIENSAEDEAGAMLWIDLDESLDRYVRERASLVERLRQLSQDEWQKTAVHEAFDHYSVFIMFRHLLNHEMLHAYRIEELLLKKDWDEI